MGKLMKKPFYKVLYVQVLAAIVIGVLLGFFFPDIGALMKPLGDGFIKLIKMLIAPVIFCTVVIGIAGMEDMKKVGKVGGIALLYFEIVTTLALLVGLFLVNVLQPGVGHARGSRDLGCELGLNVRNGRKAAVHTGLHFPHYSFVRGRRFCTRRYSSSLVLFNYFRICTSVLRRLSASYLRTH